jgi:acid phosphatase
MRALFPASVFAAALLAGCASLSIPPPAPVVPATRQAQTPPPDDTLNATAWFQTSVERDLVFRQTYRAAAGKLPAALADKTWDALPKGDRDNDPRALPAAIIVDVDETVLDNSPNQARLIRAGAEFNDADWEAWVQQRAARPLPGALEFLNAAARQGVTVFYISNRSAAQAQATVDNLRRAGFPIAGTGQFLGKGTVVPGCVAKGSDKGCRRRSVGRGYRVLMQFGDQVGDFVDIASNTREGRRQVIAPYAEWVGERWWTLPNPVYGSWEPALFGNDWQQPAAARRAAKEAALDTAR